MTNTEMALYASATAKMISVRGEEPRARVLAMLRAMGLTEENAAAVVTHGLQLGLFLEDQPSATLRMPRKVRDEAADEEKQAAARALAADVERRVEILRLVLQSLPIVLWVMDAEGYFLHFEGKGVATMGLTEGQFLGQNFFELFSGHESATYVQHALKGETTHSFTEFGGVHWENWCFPSPDAEGRTKLIIFISINITDAKRTEQELRAKIDLIERQQRVIRELSTPIIEVWDKVLTLPLLGVVDSGRTADLMENLLAEVSRKSAQFAILDLTGVEAMDTGTASHIIRLIQALRLLGAEGIITGIQPNVAQTMVTLGLGLEGIVTLATLRSALQFCMRKAPLPAKQEPALKRAR